MAGQLAEDAGSGIGIARVEESSAFLEAQARFGIGHVRPIMRQTPTTAEKAAPRRSLRSPLAGGAPGRSGSIKWSGLLGAAQEVEHVVVAESTIAALAYPEERELAAVAQSLDGVDVQVQHLGDLCRRE
jgi:hypothetical protein